MSHTKVDIVHMLGLIFIPIAVFSANFITTGAGVVVREAFIYVLAEFVR